MNPIHEISALVTYHFPKVAPTNAVRLGVSISAHILEGSINMQSFAHSTLTENHIVLVCVSCVGFNCEQKESFCVRNLYFLTLYDLFFHTLEDLYKRKK